MKYVQTVPLALLFLVMIYFAIFNWDVFVISLNVSVGVGVITVPLVATVFLIGIFFLGLQTGLTYFIDARRNRERILKETEIGAIKKEKDLEISALKASFYEEEAVQIRQNTARIVELESEMEKLRSSLRSGGENQQQAGSLPPANTEAERHSEELTREQIGPPVVGPRDHTL